MLNRDYIISLLRSFVATRDHISGAEVKYKVVCQIYYKGKMFLPTMHQIKKEAH